MRNNVTLINQYTQKTNTNPKSEVTHYVFRLSPSDCMPSWSHTKIL